MRSFDSHAKEFQVLKNTTPALDFDGSIPLSEWKKTAKEKLNELLGLPLEICDPLFEIEYKEEQEDFINIRFSVQTEPDYFVPCHLIMPKNMKKAPLTICLSGHGSGMHIVFGKAKNEDDEKSLEEWPHRAMALRAVKDNRCALVVEARNFGESSVNGIGTSCTEASKIAILMGRTVIGERCWDVMRILDAIEKEFDFVDFSDIVCTGNSGGGTATYYLACLDERIGAALPSCSICSYEASIAAMPHCLCNHIPYIRKYFEMGDLAGLIAPRKLVIAAGEKDGIFPIDATKKTFEKIQFIYDSIGKGKNCALVVGEKGHLNYADLLWAKYEQMK